MSWDDVRRLHEAGMAIGSRSHDHRRLAVLSETSSVSSWRSRSGSPPSTARVKKFWDSPIPLADPERTTSDDASARPRVGYRLAFSSTEGVNHAGASDAFALRRLGVGFHDSLLFPDGLCLRRASGPRFFEASGQKRKRRRLTQPFAPFVLLKPTGADGNHAAAECAARSWRPTHALVSGGS